MKSPQVHFGDTAPTTTAGRANRFIDRAGITVAQDNWRRLSSVRGTLAGVVYLLDAFQKKSKSSIKTPGQEIHKVKARLKEAEKTMLSGPSNSGKRSKKPTEEPCLIDRGSGNVFADLDLPNPDIALAKAELVQRIRGIIAERKLTQAQAAELLGLDQPKVSALVRGRVEGYSIDRLFRFLNALGQRVEITVRPNADRRELRAVVVT